MPRIGGNDEHGMKPIPTPGKRTPVLKQDIVIDGKTVRRIGEQIYENEFNRAAKYALEAECRRQGWAFTDAKPEDTDIAIATRKARLTAAKVDIAITYAFNSSSGGNTWPEALRGGYEILTNKQHTGKYTESVKLANAIVAEMKNTGYTQANRGVKDIGLSMTTMQCPAVVMECGFMDYMPEARLMLDTAYHKAVAAATARGIAKYLGIDYKPEAGAGKPVEGLQGWTKKGSEWYYYENGEVITGWARLAWDGVTNWYYFDPAGIMKKGWFWDGRKWYYMAENGIMVTGYNTIEYKGVTSDYFFHESGAMASNEFISFAPGWRYFGKSGAMYRDTTLPIDDRGVIRT